MLASTCHGTRVRLPPPPRSIFLTAELYGEVVGDQQRRDSKQWPLHDVPDLLHSLSGRKIPAKRCDQLAHPAGHLALRGKDAIASRSGYEQASASGFWGPNYAGQPQSAV